MAVQAEDLKTHINSVIFALSKQLRLKHKTEIHYLAQLTGQDPNSFFESRQGKHWSAKKQLEAYSVHWRSTGEEQILLQKPAASLLKLTPHQVAYRSSKGNGVFHLTRINPETSCEDVITVTRVYLPPGSKF